MSYNKEERSDYRPKKSGSNILLQPSLKKTSAGRKVFGGCSLVLLLIIGFGAGIFWLVNSMLRAEDNFSIEGRPLVAEANGIPYLVSIVGYFKASQVEKSGGRTYKSGNTTYWLCCRELPSGKLVKKIKLNGASAQYFARQYALWTFDDKYLYMLSGKPVKATIPSLEITEVESDINDNLMPAESRFYIYDPKSNTIWIDLLDGKKAMLKTEMDRVQEFKESVSPDLPSDAEMRQYLRYQSGIHNEYTNFISWNDITGNEMRAWIPEHQDLKTFSQRRMQDYFYRDNERLILYKTRFNYSNSELFIEPEQGSLEMLESEPCLQAGFLKSDENESIYRIKDDYIILHRSLIGPTGNLKVNRISPSGHRIWTADIMVIEDFKQVLTFGEMIIFIGKGGTTKSNQVICLDADTGEATSFPIAF